MTKVLNLKMKCVFNMKMEDNYRYVFGFINLLSDVHFY